MTHILNIAILSESDSAYFKEQFALAKNTDGIEWLFENSQRFSIGMYKEILGKFCTCFNKDIFQSLNIPLKESQYFWMFNYEQKEAILHIFNHFIQNHTKEILNGIKDLVHNQQVYVNATSIDNLSMSIDKAYAFIKNYQKGEVIVLLPTKKMTS